MIQETFSAMSTLGFLEHSKFGDSHLHGDGFLYGWHKVMITYLITFRII